MILDEMKAIMESKVQNPYTSSETLVMEITLLIAHVLRLDLQAAERFMNHLIYFSGGLRKYVYSFLYLKKSNILHYEE